MELKAAQIIVVNMMHEHGLRGWRFGWMDHKRTIADCNCRGREIRFSRAFVPNMSEDDVRQTALHEIAHALTPGHGHDRVWRAQARALGCRTARSTAAGITTGNAPYVAECANGHKVERFRLSDRMKPGQSMCRTCKQRGIRNFFQWKHAATGALVYPPVKSTGNAVRDMLIREAQKPVRVVRSTKTTYNGRGAFDRGFTDIESLFGD